MTHSSSSRTSPIPPRVGQVVDDDVGVEVVDQLPPHPATVVVARRTHVDPAVRPAGLALGVGGGAEDLRRAGHHRALGRAGVDEGLADRARAAVADEQHAGGVGRDLVGVEQVVVGLRAAAGGQLGAGGAFRRRRTGGRHDHDGQRDRHRDGGGDADGPAGPAAPPDGLLDRHVRQAGDGEREADPHRVERPAVDAGPVGADEHDDRPVPQVDAVADRAQHGQRRQRQGLPQRAGGATRDRPDHDQRRHGEHQQAAPVVGRRQPVDGHAHPPDEGERRDRRRGERRRGPALPPGPVERPDRQRRAEEGRCSRVSVPK